ncbi:hypothetical protein SAMN05192588_2330 [Nonlabens sp. Hel1_33_55]|uniref:DUF6265 family protein n=1 Tax=Nonlabens sp. Hel1_33_55 TaxID=1336802 RepID=UPI000875C4A3|nr:DUF6265 family protein [Nonlabens sp. Hel1_33_55]SCY33531.1 hypothetical protein SAMN05192588_2330 [Nonlabens sp. Hel1_33_55]
MKYSFLVVALIFISCKSDKDNYEPQSIDWMLGSWVRVDGRSDRTSYEVWEKNGDDYVGIGYTLQNNDTIFKEEMRLTDTGQWMLVVSGAENGDVAFISQELQDDKLSVYNPMHDFPKEIHYWIQDDTLRASVGNDGEKIEFSFVKR